jgi:HEPN/RES N-terminal domain 1/RES domain
MAYRSAEWMTEMGYWKDVIERMGGGNPEAYGDAYVCAGCFDDQGLKDIVESEAEHNVCTYCGAESDELISTSLVNVLLHIKESLDREYDAAENKLPYEGAEGGYIGEVWSTRELLETQLGTELRNDEDGTLFDALADGLGERIWCRRHPFSLTDDERLSFSWDEFCRLVKHRRHYFFLREQRQGDELYSPLALLKELATWCERFNLVRPLSAVRLYRARYQEPGEQLSTASELGPPPEEKATMSNRMSPPGIVMFYVSDNPETALRETSKSPGTFAIGEFITLREAKILDLVDIPTIPSIFESIPDSLEYDPRPPTIFLNYFTTELSKPIARDDRVHVEYIPTQVITEFFRTEFRHDGERIDGIRYRSARHSDHSSFVLFATQNDLVDDERTADAANLSLTSDPWIKLTDHQQRGVTADDLEGWNRKHHGVDDLRRQWLHGRIDRARGEKTRHVPCSRRPKQGQDRRIGR